MNIHLIPNSLRYEVEALANDAEGLVERVAKYIEVPPATLWQAVASQGIIETDDSPGFEFTACLFLPALVQAVLDANENVQMASFDTSRPFPLHNTGTVKFIIWFS